MNKIDLTPPSRMTLDEITYRLSRGVRSGRLTGWSRGFALSVMRQAKRPRWSPSAKQRLVLERLVEEMRRSEPDVGADAELIDFGDDGGGDG